MKLANPQLENGTVDPRAGLLTYPQNIFNGYIQGIFPPYRVKAGDRFRSIVNCAYGATSCYVVFRLDYQTGSSGILTFWAFVEKYDNQFYQVDLDLSPLVGQDVKFILTVLSTGSPNGDRALWVAPIIFNSLGTTPTPHGGYPHSYHRPQCHAYGNAAYRNAELYPNSNDHAAYAYSDADAELDSPP